MELKTVTNPIDSAGVLKQTLSNLFYGWGYNFYRTENKLRADDLLIRSKLSDLLAEARAHIGALESIYRREFLPPPTREHPFPDAEAVRGAKALSRAQQAIEALEVRSRTASVPEMDRVNQRHREERGTLESLSAVDIELVEAVLVLKDKITAILPESILSGGPKSYAMVVSEAEQASRAFDPLWKKREDVLSALTP